MLFEVCREVMRPRGRINQAEIKEAALLRVEYSAEGHHAGIRDGPGRQTAVYISIEGIVDLEIPVVDDIRVRLV